MPDWRQTQGLGKSGFIALKTNSLIGIISRMRYNEMLICEASFRVMPGAMFPDMLFMPVMALYYNLSDLLTSPVCLG